MTHRVLALPLLLLLGFDTMLPQSESLLEQILFTGLVGIDEPTAARLCGLSEGQAITPEQVKAAAQRLGSSGFFSRVAFRYQTVGGRMTVTFDLEEAVDHRQCLFDNFVGFSEAELYQAIRTQLPTFSGSVPENGDAVERVAVALDELLRQQGLPGSVRYQPFFDSESKTYFFLFSVEGRTQKITELDFSGVTAFPDQVLQETGRELLHQEFSIQRISRFLAFQLLPLFREQGYLQVRVDPPIGRWLETPAPSPGGSVQVQIKVREGRRYIWAGVTWVGNQTLPTTTLDQLLDMPIGQIADGKRLEAGFQAIRNEYGRYGLIGLKLERNPQLSPQEPSVIYEVSIDEGATYRMGKLAFQGFSESDRQLLKRRWELPPGEIYDASYLSRFLDRVLPDLTKPPGRTVQFGTITRIDSKNRLVDVTISAK